MKFITSLIYTYNSLLNGVNSLLSGTLFSKPPPLPNVISLFTIIYITIN